MLEDIDHAKQCNIDHAKQCIVYLTIKLTNYAASLVILYNKKFQPLLPIDACPRGFKMFDFFSA